MPKTKMMRATRELVYETRRMQPGTVFEVDGRYVVRLLATGKAVVVRAPADVPPPPPAVAAKIAAAMPPAPPPAPAPAPSVSVGAITTAQMGNAPPPPADVAAARAEYERVSGKKAFNGWDVATLQAKTAAAKTV